MTTRRGAVGAVHPDPDSHPDLSPAAARALAAADLAGLPRWSALSVPAARRLEDTVFAPTDPPAVGAVRELAVDGPAGEVPVRVYRPARSPAPTLVVYHGGGFVLGTLDSVDGLCRRLCRRTPALVVSVDYRLAPAHPFPAAVEDAVAALDWTAGNAADLGGDPDRLVVAGTSAGAALATAVARHAVRHGGPVPDRQVLAYPMTDPTGAQPSREEHAAAPLLSAADLDWFWDHYLRSELDRANPYAAPAVATDHTGLPPATVLTADVDPLRDEGRAYAEALAADGVAVDHRHEPGLPHGFLSLAETVPAADRALDAVAAAVAGRDLTPAADGG